MGTVLLTGNNELHGGSYESITLNPSLLNDQKPWFFERSSKEWWIMMYAMLRGLVTLKGVNASVSLELLDDRSNGPALALPGRLWGNLWIDVPNDPILSFIPDYPSDVSDIKSLPLWLGDEWPDKMSDDDPDCLATFRIWQDEHKWHDFFERRLLSQAQSFQRMGNEARAEGARLEALADRILRRSIT